MKILFYINTLSSGGAERVMTNLANYFRQKNNDVILVNSFPVENEYALNAGVAHLYLETEKSRQNFLLRNVSRIRKLRKILKREKPDIAIAFMAEPNFRLIVAGKGLKTKLLVSVRNDPETENKKRIQKIITKYVLKNADSVVFQTKEAQAYFDKSITEHSAIIFNPVKNSIYNIKNNGSRKNIVTAGRLTPQKNHLMLIEAFSMVANTTDDNLLIYGEGHFRSKLQERIDEVNLGDRIFLMGNSENLHDEIKTAKMFVFSSNYEGMPNALMEAMALGLPCIATDCPCGGPRMLIDDGKNGFLVPVGDTKELAEKMKFMLSFSDEERDIVGEKARETAQSFKADVVCKEWEEHINSLVMYKS